jgi:hypothetical protein
MKRLKIKDEPIEEDTAIKTTGREELINFDDECDLNCTALSLTVCAAHLTISKAVVIN